MDVGISFNLLPFLGLRAAISLEISSGLVSKSAKECWTRGEKILWGTSGISEASFDPILQK